MFKYMTLEKLVPVSAAIEIICPGLATRLSIPCPSIPCPGDERCQLFQDSSSSVIMYVIHLNDSHQWTRERIADWLETIDVDMSITTKPKEQVYAEAGAASEAIKTKYLLSDGNFDTVVNEYNKIKKILGKWQLNKAN